MKVTKVPMLKKTFLMFGIAVSLVTGCGTEDPTGMMDPAGDPVPGSTDPGGTNPGDPAPDSNTPEPQDPTLFTSWLISGGELILEYNDDYSVKGLILNEDGTGRLFLRDLRTNGRDCTRVYVEYDGESLLLDLSAEPLRQESPNRTMRFPFVVFDDDSLSLADEHGHLSNFNRVEEMPAFVVCGELDVVESYTQLPVPRNEGGVYTGDLVKFNGALVYNSSNDMIERFDYINGVMGTPLGPTGRDFVFTEQTESFITDLWTACYCGRNTTIRRTDLDTVFDKVDTDGDIGRRLFIFGAAYDATWDRLWVHGANDDNHMYEFQIYQTDDEPNELWGTVAFDRIPSGLAFHGNELWAIVNYASRSIVRIDALAGEVLDSYEVPDEDVNVSGLTFVGDDMYLLGATQDGAGILYKVATP